MKKIVLYILFSFILSIQLYGKDDTSVKYYKFLTVDQSGYHFTKELKSKRKREGIFFKVTYNEKNQMIKYEKFSSYTSPRHVVYFRSSKEKDAEQYPIIFEEIYQLDGTLYQMPYFDNRGKKIFKAADVTDEITGYLFVTFSDMEDNKFKSNIFNKDNKLLYQYFYNKENKIIQKHFYLNGKAYLVEYYNDQGQLIKEEEHWEKNEEDFSKLYFYNSDGQEIRREIRKNNNYVGHFINYYNNKKFVKQVFITAQGEITYQIMYFDEMNDSNNIPPKFSKPLELDSLNPYRYYTVYYDEDNKIAKYETFINRHLFGYSKYEYDKKGGVVTEEIFSKDQVFITLNHYKQIERHAQFETWEDIVKFITVKGNPKTPVKIQRFNVKGNHFNTILCYFNEFRELERYEVYLQNGHLYTKVHFKQNKPLREEIFNASQQLSIIKEYDADGNINSTHFLDGTDKVKEGTPTVEEPLGKK